MSDKKLVMQRREVTVNIPDYPGFSFRMWVNAPQSYFNLLMGQGLEEPVIEDGADDPTEEAIEAAAAANTEKLNTALGAIVMSHNGWCDFDGNPLPPTTDVEAFWKALPQELANVMVSLILTEVGKLAGSVRTKNRR